MAVKESICVLIFVFSVNLIDKTRSEPDVVLAKCPGRYCGRTLDQQGNFSRCGACPRGHRPDEASVCQRCQDTPTFYDWLYLGFMALLVPAMHWFFIDFTNKRKNGRLMILHVCALLESALAAVLTVLVVEPRGEMSVRSCAVHHLSDWYAVLFNPRPDYIRMVHCTQEAVFPLYTMVMIYYALCLVLMMLVRPVVSSKLVNHYGTKSIYAALYAFPVLVVVQAVLAGLIYYSFPYIVIGVSTVTCAAHLALAEEQSVSYLLKATCKNPRNLIILLCHWVLHGYGIISVTELKNPGLHAPMLLLVPCPALFYLLTVHFTSPDTLDLV